MANLGLAPILFGSHVSGVSLPSEITVDAADFDGSNDYLIRAASLNSVTNSKKGILSFWIRLDAATTGEEMILSGSTFPNETIRVGIGSELFFIRLQYSTTFDDVALSMSTTNTYSGPSATWYHILMSWDTETSSAHLYVNDTSDKSVTTIANQEIDYTVSQWNVGTNLWLNHINGALAEFYFAPGQYLDFSQESNRRLFISETGDPVDLGADGSDPTSTVPAIYLHLDDAENADNFANNLGGGGSFTLTGDLDTASSSPSD